MKFKKKEKMFKDCPRCGIRCLATAESCQECGLVFARMEVATNADAKKKIKRGDKDYIIKTSQLPHDITFAKLLTLCACTGIVGGHCYYVGKYKQAIIQTVAVSIILLFGVFNSWIYANGLGTVMEITSTILGFTMMLWPIDLVLILMKKFKVPVAIDIDGDLVHAKQKETYVSSVEQAAKEVEIAKAMAEIVEEKNKKKDKLEKTEQQEVVTNEPSSAQNNEIVIEEGESDSKQEISVDIEEGSATEENIVPVSKNESAVQEKTAVVIAEKPKQKTTQNRSQYKQTVKKYDANGKKKRKK